MSDCFYAIEDYDKRITKCVFKMNIVYHHCIYRTRTDAHVDMRAMLFGRPGFASASEDGSEMGESLELYVPPFTELSRMDIGVA